MMENRDSQNLTAQFIKAKTADRRLDERTVKAYDLDLSLFYSWLESENGRSPFGKNGDSGEAEATENGLEKKMQTYLDYLSEKRGLRFSTIRRKQQVLSYYLSFLVSQGIIKDFKPLKLAADPVKTEQKEAGWQEETQGDQLLSKKEIDVFFEAIRQEYQDLDSDFRRRVCLRDQIMMELLFYHGIEISELLRMKVSDYDRKTALLHVRRKREKERQVRLFSRELQGRMEIWLGEHEYFEHDGTYHDRMFLSKLGKPLSMKMVINIFDKYKTKAGIKKECSPKDLKNSLGRYAEEMMREMC